MKTSSFPHVSVTIKGVDQALTLEDWSAITKDWAITNGRRTELIEKKVGNRITPPELDELTDIQRLAGARRQLISPLPTGSEFPEVVDWRDILPHVAEADSDCRDCD